MLGVFLLPAFTRLGHECQDLLSPCVYRLDFCLHSHPKGFFVCLLFFFLGGGGVESEHMLTPKEKKNSPGG